MTATEVAVIDRVARDKEDADHQRRISLAYNLTGSPPPQRGAALIS
jgi:hypothetical protein